MNASDIWGVLSSGLGAVGGVLDAPRSTAYAGLVNPAYHALGGDPNRRIGHFSDLLQAAGMDKDSVLTQGLGVAGDMATDPLTYAGMALGGGLGAAKAFEALGPMEGANAAKLAGLAVPEAMADRGGVGMIQQALGSPEARSILNEIPAGSTFQGAGAESLAMKTPQGDVLRLSPYSKASAIDIPNVEGINAPTRRVAYGDVEVSRTPMATDVGRQDLFDRYGPELEKRLGDSGVQVIDPIKPEDMGMVNGKPSLLDLGSIDVPNPGAGGFRPIYGQTPAGFRAAGAALGGAAGGVAGRFGSALAGY